MDEWCPSVKVLKTWPHFEWPKRYIEWLRSCATLPYVPVISHVHPLLKPLWNILRDVHDMPEEHIIAWQAHQIDGDDVYEISRNYKHTIERQRLKEERERYDDLIREMLEFSGSVTPELIRKYRKAIRQKQPYNGPMA